MKIDTRKTRKEQFKRSAVFRATVLIGLSFFAALSVASCGQETIELPESKVSGLCQANYPTPVKDSGGAYGVKEGNTFPCMVFESVRSGSYDEPRNTHINLDDVHISYRLGDIEAIANNFGTQSDVAPQYLFFISAAVNCPECTKYAHDVSENVELLEDSGFLPVALANNDLLSPDKGLDVETSEELLEEDQWPTPWLRTNDEADNLTSQMALWPTTIVVRLQDMKVLVNSSGIGNTRTLMDEVAKQDAALEVDLPVEERPNEPVKKPDEPDPEKKPDEPDGPLCFTCEGPICMRQMEGELLFSDGKPCVDCLVQICTPACKSLQTDSKGRFVYDLGADCRGFDFHRSGPIHFQILASRDTHATYSAEYEPTQAEVGDGMSYDLGTHYLYPFGGGGVSYDGSASVDLNKDGVQMTIAPGELEVAEGESLEINVLRFPLDQWVPPFIEDASKVDALFALSPYFAGFEDPSGQKDFWSVELSVALSELGWDAASPGTVRVLGDFYKGKYLTCSEGGDSEIQGLLTECGPLRVEGDRVFTAIPRLVWLAFESE